MEAKRTKGGPQQYLGENLAIPRRISIVPMKDFNSIHGELNDTLEDLNSIHGGPKAHGRAQKTMENLKAPMKKVRASMKDLRALMELLKGIMKDPRVPME